MSAREARRRTARSSLRTQLDPPIFHEDLSLDAGPEWSEYFGWVFDTVQGSPSYARVFARCQDRAPEADEAATATYADQLVHLAPETVLSALQSRLFAGFDLAGALWQVQCPLLLLYGDRANGAAMRDEDAAFVRAILPSAVAVKIAGGNHMLIDQHQEEVMQQFGTFMLSR